MEAYKGEFRLRSVWQEVYSGRNWRIPTARAQIYLLALALMGIILQMIVDDHVSVFI